jgi:hypothetical protein
MGLTEAKFGCGDDICPYSVNGYEKPSPKLWCWIDDSKWKSLDDLTTI